MIAIRVNLTPTTLIGGEKVIRAITKCFYQKMASSTETTTLLAIHRRPLRSQKLFEFLSGWLGGPQLYQQNMVIPALRARHMHVDIDEAMRDQWLFCMKFGLKRILKARASSRRHLGGDFNSGRSYA